MISTTSGIIRTLSTVEAEPNATALRGHIIDYGVNETGTYCFDIAAALAISHPYVLHGTDTTPGKTLIDSSDDVSGAHVQVTFESYLGEGFIVQVYGQGSEPRDDAVTDLAAALWTAMDGCFDVDRSFMTTRLSLNGIPLYKAWHSTAADVGKIAHTGIYRR